MFRRFKKIKREQYRIPTLPLEAEEVAEKPAEPAPIGANRRIWNLSYEIHILSIALAVAAPYLIRHFPDANFLRDLLVAGLPAVCFVSLVLAFWAILKKPRLWRLFFGALGVNAAIVMAAWAVVTIVYGPVG